MTFSFFVEIVSDKHKNWGRISDLYFELLGLLFTKDLGKLFKWYKNWDLKKNDKNIESLLKSIFLLDKNEKYFLFFNSYSDLVQAFSEFEDLLYYLRNSPSKKYLKNISLFEWGNYHLRSIHSQYYILKERTLKFVKTIKRLAKGGGDKRFLKLTVLEKEITDYFEPLLKERHDLVHKKAFMNERLLQINARGSRLIKTRMGKQKVFKISEKSNVEKRIKVDLYAISIEIVKYLNGIIRFLNKKFEVLSSIVGDWYEDWYTEY